MLKLKDEEEKNTKKTGNINLASKVINTSPFAPGNVLLNTKATSSVGNLSGGGGLHAGSGTAREPVTTNTSSGFMNPSIRAEDAVMFPDDNMYGKPTNVTTDDTEQFSGVVGNYIPFAYDDYVESAAVAQARQQALNNSVYAPNDAVTGAYNAWTSHSATRPDAWNGGTHAEAVQSAWDRINNREAFSYDVNADALYQQYKNQYMTQGKLAMQDAIGKASAMTGGYGNSYAATVGNQAYQGYVNKLNDVVPQLYQLAYDKYNQETKDLYNQYDLAKNMYDTEYNQYRDTVNDWNTEENRLRNNYTTLYNNDRSAFENDRSFAQSNYQNERNWDYGLYGDAYNKALTQHNDMVSQDKANRELAFKEATANASQSSSGGGGSYADSVNNYLNSSSASYEEAMSILLDDLQNEIIDGSEYNTAKALIEKQKQMASLSKGALNGKQKRLF